MCPTPTRDRLTTHGTAATDLAYTGMTRAMATELVKTLLEEMSYWQRELEHARDLGDAERMAQCEGFVKQCEEAMATLNLVESRGCMRWYSSTKAIGSRTHARFCSAPRSRRFKAVASHAVRPACTT